MTSHLIETAEVILPSVVALASLAVPARLRFEPNAGFPEILGTGFVVDPRGVVMTAAHVARALQALPINPQTGEPSAVAILFPKPEMVNGGLEMRPLLVGVKGYSLLEHFTTNENIFHGEKLPDLAFVQLRACDLPRLSFVTEPSAIRPGLSVAFAGFPLGSDGLLLRLHDTQAAYPIQATPFLRHGIISGVHPFPCPQPHGFSIDAMSSGGASGSPIFQNDDPRVIGMLYAAFEGEARLTYALPGHLLHWAAKTALEDGTLDMDGVSSIQEYKARRYEPSAWFQHEDAR